MENCVRVSVFNYCSVVYITHIPFLTFQDHPVCGEFSVVISYKTVSRSACGFEMRCFVWIRNWAELLGLVAHFACWGQKNYVSKLCNSLLGQNSVLVYNSSHCFSHRTTQLLQMLTKLLHSENELLWSVKTPGHWALSRLRKTSASRAAGFCSVGLGRLLLFCGLGTVASGMESTCTIFVANSLVLLMWLCSRDGTRRSDYR